MINPLLLCAMLFGELPAEHSHAAIASGVPRSTAELQRRNFDARVAQYARLAEELGRELHGGDYDDAVAALLDDERMTAYLGLGVAISRDVGRSSSLQQFARQIDAHDRDRSEGPIFRRPEVASFVAWLESLSERFELETLLRISASLPGTFSAPEDVGREMVHLLYDPSLPSELRAMLHAGVRISARGAVLYSARASDLDDATVARVFAAQSDDARAFEQLIALTLVEQGLPSPVDGTPSRDELLMLREQIEWNRTRIAGWLSESPGPQG